MLRTPVVYAGLSFAVLCGAYVFGCSSDTETTPADERQPGAQPPGPPADGVPGDGSGFTFAVNKLFLGGTDRSGSPNPSAWKNYGYNLDGLITSQGSPNHCQPAAGGSPKVMDDGDQGIDNGFGKSLMPLILSLANDAQEQVNDSIEEGVFTIMLDLEKLGTGPSYVDIFGRLYAGAEMDSVPKWDGTDAWPVVPELLDDQTDIKSSKVQFPDSYVNNHVWVSGSYGDLSLSLAVAGYALTLTISQAIISMEMNPDRSGAMNGIIAGVLETEALVNEIKKVAGGFSKEFCSGTTIESLLDQLRGASDIMKDGTQSPSKTCDAISVGLGFEAKPVMLGEIGDPTPPQADPCEEGGSGGTGGSSTGGSGGMAGGSGGMGCSTGGGGNGGSGG